MEQLPWALGLTGGLVVVALVAIVGAHLVFMWWGRS